MIRQAMARRVRGGAAAYLAGALSAVCVIAAGAYAQQALANWQSPARTLAQQPGGPRPAAVQLSAPQGVAVDAQGFLYVADTDHGRVVKLSPAGQALAEWRVGAQGASAPSGIVVDAGGNLYVSDWQAGQILKLAPTGALLAQWGAPGAGPGELDGPRGLALDAEGNLYVADSGNGRIQKLGPGGDFLARWGAEPAQPAPAASPSPRAEDGRPPQPPNPGG